MTTLTVDIWSDLVCPWCYVGKRRFDKALAAFPGRDRVRVRWRSFELDPDGSREPSLTLPERSNRDLGGDRAETDRRMAMLTQLAAEEGLVYRLDRARAVNSFDAHRLMQYADRKGRGEQVRERLMSAYVAEGAIMSDLATLVRLAAEGGLDPGATRAVLDGDAFADEVRADERRARELGVSGVPTFVFGERYAVSGAQPVEVFAEVLGQALALTEAGGGR
ncbi:protein disulfide isomerase FrnE [Nonomuraea antimicrobica]|uniref:Protein disulfide isomerase FrnE n=1 Tax=Nonomuraea antimicrobica TaxID=561173 RepID=A0ABP7CUF4_9ACTN